MAERFCIHEVSEHETCGECDAMDAEWLRERDAELRERCTRLERDLAERVKAAATPANPDPDDWRTHPELRDLIAKIPDDSDRARAFRLLNEALNPSIAPPCEPAGGRDQVSPDNDRLSR